MDFKQLFQETKDLSVLFVEDYIELREHTTEILESYFGYCQSAVDGKDGLAHYIAYQKKYGKYFDLVITDIKMPELDGVSLTKKIYQLNENQSIIILSAHNESEYLLPLINLGIAQFITKPIDHDNLLSVLYRVCKKINQKISVDMRQDKIVFSKDAYFDKNVIKFVYKNVMIKLTKNELLLMKLFSQQFEKIYSNEEIINYFEYEGATISNDNIRSLVAKLRKKLPINCIESIYGLGYKLYSNYEETI